MGFRPLDETTAPPRLRAPAGACDCHMHFYNARFPSAPSALITPDDAWVEDYRKLQAHLGLERVVVVQPTTYGLDNSCQVAALEAFGKSARAVFVVERDTSEAELQRLHALGGRGARFHMLPGGALGWDALEEVAAKIAPLGWHIQLQLNGRELPEHASRLAALPCPLVIDHLGRFTPPVEPDHPAFKQLLDLLESGRCWVKLSAPYESFAAAPLDYALLAPLARALVRAAPERMLWASNWPHPGKDWLPEDAPLLDLLLEWVEDETLCGQILADNPAALYGF